MSQAYSRQRVVQVNVVHCRGYRSSQGGARSTQRVRWPGSCSRRRPRTRPRSPSGGDLTVTISAERPRLVLPGLLPADPRLERYRVHPGPSPPSSSTRATCSRSPTPKAGSGVSSPCSPAAGRTTGRSGRRPTPRPRCCARWPGPGAPAPGAPSTRARWRPAVGGGSRRGHRPAGGAGARPGADARGGAVRGVVARGHAGGVHRAAAADLRGGRARRADGRGRAQPAFGPGDRGPADGAAAAPRAAPAAAARRPRARPAGRHRHRALLRGGGGPVHPGHRRRGPPVLRLPGVPRRSGSPREPNAAWTRLPRAT